MIPVVVEVSFAAGGKFSEFSKMKKIRQSETRTKLDLCILLKIYLQIGAT